MSRNTPTKNRKVTTAAKIAGVDEKTIDSLLTIFKSLSDKSRLQILLMLAKEGELHVTQLCEALGQSQPAVSHHLTQLRNAELVAYRRDGKYNHYKIDSDMVLEIVGKFYPNARSSQRKLVFGEMELNFKAK
ncbi:metalloregulator ArsR/SmtB family transcription factor [Telmatocola sphagniphila]|jgi:ArsR family transcriptional regulator|uniref:Metalloregulator ArsR/SmtB family transcription factor n=1 Tax=Telmatocola sphagniphila TaxID=1123043 RepID=A0A8E6B4F7_9BACT|nr:metalloregulator ArsR/SmtB family transcription factor [Telmatocola sphagniphila]QVL31980.1 metalloregulator ArsR/SmtB family transcription factor [Telmatocola sphagniphila]